MPEFYIPKSSLWILVWRNHQYNLWRMRDFYQFTHAKTMLPPTFPVGSKNLQHLAILMDVHIPEHVK